MALFELDQSYEPPSEEWTPPTFRDCLKADLELAFFNMNEFAEFHNVEGKDVLVVIQEDSTRERDPREDNSCDKGMYKVQMVLYIRTEDYGPLPPVGKQVTIDERHLRVKQCVEEGGVYRMELKEWRQR